ncbi:hypothetical protein CYMTET_33213 [Cymbomonas tetramitiformis]|nr:hypothetical protein CYMTET_33213 [Cymbomonas tetramitiformis]
MKEMQWHNEMWAICAGGAVFLMSFVHPGVATNMFQIFNCQKIHFDDPSLKMQYWLKEDMGLECQIVGEWGVAMFIAVVTIVSFVFGFPAFIFFGMRHLRAYQSVKMNRETAERHLDLVRDGLWIPCELEDLTTYQLTGSLFGEKRVDGASDSELTSELGKFTGADESVPGADVDAALVQPEDARDGEGLQGHAAVRLEARDRFDFTTFTTNDVRIKSILEEDSAGGEAKLYGVREELSTQREVPSTSAGVPKFSVFGQRLSQANKLKEKWMKKAFLRNEEPVSLFLLRSTFEECSVEGKKAELAARPSTLLWKGLRTARERMQSKHAEMRPNAELSSAIKLFDGRVIEGVQCLLKPEQGDGGVICHVAITRLDATKYAQVLGQFRDPFEDEFYYWQCYEISRRVLQTGAVLVVYMLTGEDASLIYAVMLATFAIVLHQRYSPYKNDAMDNLQIAVLVGAQRHLDADTSGAYLSKLCQ